MRGLPRICLDRLLVLVCGTPFAHASLWYKAVKGPPAKAGGLVGSTAVVVPTSPTLTRLSSGGSGQSMEATTLVPSLRPTSARFLNADHSKPRLQTSSGSCTKRAGELALVPNMAEGRERESPSRSVTP